ncbi:hypothetical protein IPL68_00115 [Candidatus Saccharibacteria bacterium]|nr:MAG: hypothetical protein IPL68_00115 [Candidatus Saccharibacteria bacterium]
MQPQSFQQSAQQWVFSGSVAHAYVPLNGSDATLINLLLTQFFEFSRVEFGALPGFVFNLLLLAVINAAIAEEIRRAVD